MVRAYASAWTNFDWVVEVDGIRRARYSQYSQDSVFLAARKANEYRREEANNGHVPAQSLDAERRECE